MREAGIPASFLIQKRGGKMCRHRNRKNNYM